MYPTPSPMLKYDQIFGTSARNWEAANSQNQDIQRWPGHCLGGAVASIMLNEPIPAPGSGMTQDELKALWAELGENHYNHPIGDYANEIPAGPPRPGFDACDPFVPRFHAMLETHIRGDKQALLGNLRAFPPRGTANEVWNHGDRQVHRHLPRRPRQGRAGRPARGRARRQLGLEPQRQRQQAPDHQVRVHPRLRPRRQGRRDPARHVRLDLGRRRGDVRPAEPAGGGRQPLGRATTRTITEANVRSLDLANGGASFGRLAGTPAELPARRQLRGRPHGRLPAPASSVEAIRAQPRWQLPTPPRRVVPVLRPLRRGAPISADEEGGVRVSRPASVPLRRHRTRGRSKPSGLGPRILPGFRDREFPSRSFKFPRTPGRSLFLERLSPAIPSRANLAFGSATATPHLTVLVTGPTP